MEKYKQLLQKIVLYRLSESFEKSVIIKDYLFGENYVTICYKYYDNSDVINIPNSEILAHIVENM